MKNKILIWWKRVREIITNNGEDGARPIRSEDDIFLMIEHITIDLKQLWKPTDIKLHVNELFLYFN